MKKITFLLLLLTFNFYGQWTNTPQSANAIVTGSDDQEFNNAFGYKNQYSVIVDAAQNFITVYKNMTSSPQDIFVQKTDIDGNVLWGDGGTNIYDGAYLYNGNTRYTGAINLQIVADGAGGAIIAFTGRDSNHYGSFSTEPKEIMAIRIDGNGNHVWGGRISVSLPSATAGFADRFRIISDGNGGTYAGWISKRLVSADTYGFQLFYQHVHSDGSVAFSGGKLLKDLNGTWPSGAPFFLSFPTIAKMPSGNIAFSWVDYNSATSNWGLFCNMIDSQGNSVWPNEVLVDTGLFTSNAMTEGYPLQLSATENGVYALYSKTDSEQLAFLNNAGSATFSGVEVSNAATGSYNFWKFDITTTPTGDAMIIADRSNGEPYLQRVNQLGQKMFGPNGYNLSSIGSGYVDAYDVRITRTSDNNYLTTFSGHFPNVGWKTMASLNDENGALLFPFGGTILAHQPMEYPNLLATDNGGAVLVGRHDPNNENMDDIFALQILPSNNPLEMVLRLGTNPIMMTTDDNLNFTVENYTHEALSELSFRKYDMANMYLPTMPTGTATYNASSSAMLPSGVYNLTYNAMTNNYEFSSSLGIHEYEQTDFKLYPNPALDNINFSQALQRAIIFDVLGNKLLEVNEPTHNLNVANLSNGVYFLKGHNNNGQTILEKFIKK